MQNECKKKLVLIFMLLGILKPKFHKRDLIRTTGRKFELQK